MKDSCGIETTQTSKVPSRPMPVLPLKLAQTGGRREKTLDTSRLFIGLRSLRWFRLFNGGKGI